MSFAQYLRFVFLHLGAPWQPSTQKHSIARVPLYSACTSPTATVFIVNNSKGNRCNGCCSYNRQHQQLMRERIRKVVILIIMVMVMVVVMTSRLTPAGDDAHRRLTSHHQYRHHRHDHHAHHHHHHHNYYCYHCCYPSNYYDSDHYSYGIF